MNDIPAKCTRCRHVHLESDRILRPRPRRSTAEVGISDHVCPKCGCKSFYDLTPQVAWCWASGLIEIGDSMPIMGSDGSGPIEIARGPKFALKSQLGARARHGQGASAGKLLAPGVPEAEDGDAAVEALIAWVQWCGKGKSRDGVIFSGQAI